VPSCLLSPNMLVIPMFSSTFISLNWNIRLH
jgi:hypothetical protein